MTAIIYETVENPALDDIAALDRGLHRFNLAHLGPDVIYNYTKVASFARDAEGAIIGGAHGDLLWEWLHIQTLWVCEAQRGQGVGSALLRRLEEQAVTRGFHHSHLETTDFQALEFYLKNGYRVFGQLDNKPTGHTWYYMRKELKPTA